MRKPGCLRAFVCAVCVPASCVCASFVPVACFSTVPLLRSHLAAPTRCGVGASCVRAGGGRAGLLWACLLAGGGVWCLRFLGVFAWVFALFGVGVFAWGGGTLCVPPPLALSVLWWCGLLALTLWCGRCWRVRCSLGCGVTVMGRDNHVPPHAVWRALSPRCVRVERERGLWAPARSGERNPSLVLAYVETGSRPVGAEQGGGASGRASVGLAGRRWRAAVVACSLAWCIQSPLPVARGWCRW